MNQEENTAERYGPEIVIIAALAEKDRLIGDGLELPWHLPEDLKRFKRLTTGHPMVMGRKTFEALVHQMGGPLPGRPHAVLTRHPEKLGDALEHEAVRAFRSLDDALDAFSDRERVFIAGGGEVYAAALDRADRMELTLVEGDYSGDTYFPPYEHLVGTLYERAGVDDRGGFRFETFRRRA
jgi:dihydrofolate reductase